MAASSQTEVVDELKLTVPPFQYHPTQVALKRTFEIKDRAILSDLPMEFSEAGVESGSLRGVQIEWSSPKGRKTSFQCQFSTLQKHYEAQLKTQKTKVAEVLTTTAGGVVSLMKNVRLINDDNGELTFFSTPNILHTLQKSDNLILTYQPTIPKIFELDTDLNAPILIIDTPTPTSDPTTHTLTLKYNLTRSLVVDHTYKLKITTSRTAFTSSFTSSLQSVVTNLSPTAFKDITEMSMLLAGAEMVPVGVRSAGSSVVEVSQSSTPTHRHKVVRAVESPEFAFSRLVYRPDGPFTILPYSTFIPPPERVSGGSLAYIFLHFSGLTFKNLPQLPTTKLYLPTIYFSRYMDLAGAADITIDDSVTASTFVDKNNQNWTGENTTEMTLRYTFPPLASITCVGVVAEQRRVMINYLIRFDIWKNIIISIDKTHGEEDSTFEPAFSDSISNLYGLEIIDSKTVNTDMGIDPQFTSNKIFFKPIPSVVDEDSQHRFTLTLNKKSN